MNINKFEAIGILLCVGVMSLALFLLRLDANTDLLGQANDASQSASVIVSGSTNELPQTLADSMNGAGSVEDIIVNDIVAGEGNAVQAGDRVTVHYIGTLQNGQQFDNSYTKGEPFVFTVGDGKVIEGWEKGILGMKKGGQRILVIPPEYAYGDKGVYPIPPNATLVFAIELLSIE